MLARALQNVGRSKKIVVKTNQSGGCIRCVGAEVLRESGLQSIVILVVLLQKTQKTQGVVCLKSTVFEPQKPLALALRMVHDEVVRRAVHERK